MYPLTKYNSKVDSEVVLDYAVALRTQKKYNLALTTLMLISQENPLKVKVAFELCRNYIKLNRTDEAIAILKNTQPALKGRYSAEYNSLLYALIKGDTVYKKIKWAFDSLVEMDPENVKVLRLLARKNEKEGDIEGAIQCYEKILTFSPYEWDAVSFTCDYLIRNGQKEKAKNRLFFVLKKISAKHKSKLLNILGGIYLSEDNIVEAAKYFEKSNKILPGNGPAILGKIKCEFWSTLKSTERMSILNSAIQSMRNDPKGIISLSCLLIHLVDTHSPIFGAIEQSFPKGIGVNYTELMEKLSQAKRDKVATQKIEDFYINKLNVFNSVYIPLPIDKNGVIGMYKPQNDFYENPVA